MLRMLSEEIFDFSKSNMTSASANELKQTMTQEFVSVFELCNYVLDTYISNPTSVKNTLVKACLKTFSAFMSWIPLGYIFQTDICDKMLEYFLTNASFRIETIKSFAEIFALKISAEDEPEANAYNEKLYIMYARFMHKISEVTNNTNFLEEYFRISESQRGHFENFSNQMALLISAFIKNNFHSIEQILANNQVDGNEMLTGLLHSMDKSLVSMVQFSFMPEESLFKICVEFWHFLTYEVMISQKGADYFSGQQDMMVQQIAQQTNPFLLNSTLRQSVYPKIFDEVRKVTIEKMAKPKEVLIVIDENGEAVEETYDDTETISLYETMRELLIHLTNIDTYSTDKIMQAKLDVLIRDESQFSFDSLNKLCWALGSIQGCMVEEDENRFVVAIVKELLNLVEQKKGKDNKAIVAANIMYVVGQFPRFLEAHWAFLRTVIKKLNEFMHEKHPGVQDMASDTFLKIAKQTKHMFIVTHDKEAEPYVNVLIRSLPDNTRDLEPHQKLLVYQGIGHMISVDSNQLNKESYIFALMSYADADFKQIIHQANQNIDYLKFPDVIRLIRHLIQINERVCFSVGHFYYQYLCKIFNELLQIYKLYSQHISAAVAADPSVHSRSVEIKSMKSVRREVLKLIQTFIQKSDDPILIVNEFVPQFSALIVDYNENLPDARDPEVILLFSTILDSYGAQLSHVIEELYNNLGNSTLQMISQDFTSYMEFRSSYFTLLRSTVKSCLFGFFSITNPELFNNLIESMIWAFKHEKFEIMELGLETANFLIEGVLEERSIATQFFGSFFLKLLEEIIVVMCDQLHLSGFDLQAKILQKLFYVVEMNQFDSTISGNQGEQSNKDFLLVHLTNAITNMFGNLNRVQVEAFVLSMFNHCQDWSLFKNSVRDLLISTKEFANREDQFYSEEKESEMNLMKERESAKRAAIPGLGRIGNSGEKKKSDLI